MNNTDNILNRIFNRLANGSSIMGGKTDKISNTITTSSGVAYTSGDNVGGIITITDALLKVDGTAILFDVEVWDKDDQKAPLTIDYWNASPSGTYTDNAAQVIAGDFAKWLGRVDVVEEDYETTGAVATAIIRNIGLTVKGSGSSQYTIYY